MNYLLIDSQEIAHHIKRTVRRECRQAHQTLRPLLTIFSSTSGKARPGTASSVGTSEVLSPMVSPTYILNQHSQVRVADRHTETKHFIYFYLGHCAILLFKTQ